MVWGNLTIDHVNQTLIITSQRNIIDDFALAVQASENKNILSKDYNQIANKEIIRYYMQVRYSLRIQK